MHLVQDPLYIYGHDSDDLKKFFSLVVMAVVLLGTILMSFSVVKFAKVHFALM